MRGRWRRARGGRTSTSGTGQERGPCTAAGRARWDHGGPGLRLRDGRTLPHVFAAVARGIGVYPVGPRKCLILYYYFMDRDFGLIHVRLQTWFPLQLQVYVNGHEWLARKLAQHGMRYTKHDNAFLWVEDFARAQRFADRFVTLPWVEVLDGYARRVNPLLPDVLKPMPYYWVTTQAEYATDLVCKSRQHAGGVLSPSAGTQHAVLLGPRCPQLPGPEVARQVRRRGGDGSVRLWVQWPRARPPRQAPHEAELAEDV